MSEALYLACYIVKTEAENASFGSFANEPDGDDDGKHFFRYEVTAPLVIYRFLQRLPIRKSRLPENSVDPSDQRTDIMRKVQREAESIALPENKKSDANWITTSDLAQQMAKADRKFTPDSEPQLIKTKRDSLNRWRAAGKRGRLWPPNDGTMPKRGVDSGWDAHKRFWRKCPGTLHPVFYFRKTIEGNWEQN